MEGAQYAFKSIEESKFSMFVLISQYYKMRWPDDDIVIDVYDDKLANPKSSITEGVGRLSRETGWIPKRVQMRFHAMDSYTLLYKERDGNEIAFVNSLKHSTSLENFKPFTSHHKLVKSINGTGKLLQHEALKEIACQCFKQPTPLGNSSGLADAVPKSPADAAPKSPVDTASKSPVDVCCITQPIHCFGIAKAATVPLQDQCGDDALPKEVGPPSCLETASTEQREVICTMAQSNNNFSIAKAATLLLQDQVGDISLSAVGHFKSDHTSGA